MQLFKACWLAFFCAAIGSYAMVVDQALVESAIPSEPQVASSSPSSTSTTTTVTTTTTSPSPSTSTVSTTLPVIVTTSTTTTTTTPTTRTFHSSTTARGSRTLYLTRYSSRDRSINNTNCDVTSGSASHTVTAVQTNRCLLFPGMTYNSTDGYYAVYSTDDSNRYYVAIGCDYACLGCRMVYSQTLGVCETSLLHPHNESLLLTESTCEGGLTSAITDLSDDELSIVHYPSSTTCQFNYNGQEEIINLGTANRHCLNVDGIGAMVQSSGDKVYTLWWGCDLACLNCQFIRANVTFDTCLPSVLTGLPGTLNIIPTRRLSVCVAEDNNSGLSTGAIVAIAVGSVALVAGLVGLGVWLAKRSRRIRYERLDN